MKIKKLIFKSLLCLLLVVIGMPSLKAIKISVKDVEDQIILFDFPMGPGDFKHRSDAFNNVWTNMSLGVYGGEEKDISQIKGAVIRDAIVNLNKECGNSDIGLFEYEAFIIRQAQDSDELLNNLGSLWAAYEGFSKNFDRVFLVNRVWLH